MSKNDKKYTYKNLVMSNDINTGGLCEESFFKSPLEGDLGVNESELKK